MYLYLCLHHQNFACYTCCCQSNQSLNGSCKNQPNLSKLIILQYKSPKKVATSTLQDAISNAVTIVVISTYTFFVVVVRVPHCRHLDSPVLQLSVSKLALVQLGPKISSMLPSSIRWDYHGIMFLWNPGH